jgi:hypothetical protein
VFELAGDKYEDKEVIKVDRQFTSMHHEHSSLLDTLDGILHTYEKKCEAAEKIGLLPPKVPREYFQYCGQEIKQSSYA